MTYAELRTALYSYLVTNWTDNATTLRTLVAVTNGSDFRTRVDGTLPAATAVDGSGNPRPFIRFNVIGLNDTQADLGPQALFYIRGHLAFQVFTAKGVGTVASDGYIDQLRDLFERKSFDLGDNEKIQCQGADAPIDGFESGQWWQRNLWIPFRASECRSIPA